MFRLNPVSYNVKEDAGSVNVKVIKVDGDDESHSIKLQTFVTGEDTATDRDYVGVDELVNMSKVSSAI